MGLDFQLARGCSSRTAVLLWARRADPPCSAAAEVKFLLLWMYHGIEGNGTHVLESQKERKGSDIKCNVSAIRPGEVAVI